jgi:hypothetical protein
LACTWAAECNDLCVPKTSSISCDQVILADQATDASLSSDAVPRKIDGFGERFQRRGAVQGAMRPVLIVMGFVGVQDSPQMGRVPVADHRENGPEDQPWGQHHQVSHDRGHPFACCSHPAPQAQRSAAARREGGAAVMAV